MKEMNESTTGQTKKSLPDLTPEARIGSPDTAFEEYAKRRGEPDAAQENRKEDQGKTFHADFGKSGLSPRQSEFSFRFDRAEHRKPAGKAALRRIAGIGRGRGHRQPGRRRRRRARQGRLFERVFIRCGGGRVGRLSDV